VIPTKPIPHTVIETDMPAEDFQGINTFGPHSMIAPNELRDLLNFDLFPGYFKSRRGATNLQTTGTKLGSKNVANGIKWAVTNTTEYVIVQLINGSTTEFWWAQILPTQTAFVQIAKLSGGNLTTTTNDPADLCLSGNRLYIFHPVGNFIIEWNGSAFVGRPMGLGKAYLTSLAAGAATGPTGLYTVGVEFVYQVAGVDIVCSSPNRKTFAGKLLEVTVSNQKITVTLDTANYPASPYDYWTHVRVWRSKRRDTDFSNPANPIDIQGLTSELYPEQLITKAALAGTGGVVTLSKLDSELPADTTSEYQIVTLSRIELSPLPMGYIGTYHRNRIWVSRAQGVNDTTQSAIYYSNSAGDAYAEQYDPQNVLRAERGDGQQCIRLISFEADLLILKEAKTMRVPNGDVSLGIEVLDGNIGVTNYRLAQFVPKVGIAAIVNDQSEFRIFDYTLRWTNVYNGLEISRTIRTQTLAIAQAPTYAGFAYINGKLLISDGTGIMYVLNAKEGKGWGRYSYPMNGNAQLLLTFSKGSRALVVSKSTYIVEIEKEGLDTDISTASDTASAIGCQWIIPRFQSRSGRDVLYMTYYSQMALLANNLIVTPFANGDYWPLKTSASTYPMTPDVGAYPVSDNGLEREYFFYMDAITPMRAQFIHYLITTSAPATIHNGYLRCLVDNSSAKTNFDPFITISKNAYTPDWLDILTLDAGASVRDLTAYTTYDAGFGVRSLGSFTTLDRG
jgi:hypothetical protein